MVKYYLRQDPTLLKLMPGFLGGLGMEIRSVTMLRRQEREETVEHIVTEYDTYVEIRKEFMSAVIGLIGVGTWNSVINRDDFGLIILLGFESIFTNEREVNP